MSNAPRDLEDDNDDDDSINPEVFIFNLQFPLCIYISSIISAIQVTFLL